MSKTAKENAAKAALAALQEDRARSLSGDLSLPKSAGIYAFHGKPEIWAELGLEFQAGTPLYVGRALTNKGLRRRVEEEHGNWAATGWSTLRRSLAALLHERLGLRAVPRQKDRRITEYELATRKQEAVLTGWMERHLSVVAWSAPSDPITKELEVVVQRKHLPPLHPKQIGTANQRRVWDAREAMREQARASA